MPGARQKLQAELSILSSLPLIDPSRVPKRALTPVAGALESWRGEKRKEDNEKKLEFVWADHSGSYLTSVTFTLKKEGKATRLEIHERGWKQAHLGNAFDNCSGWTIYLTYLKAYLMLGKDLRTEKQ